MEITSQLSSLTSKSLSSRPVKCESTQKAPSTSLDVSQILQWPFTAYQKTSSAQTHLQRGKTRVYCHAFSSSLLSLFQRIRGLILLSFLLSLSRRQHLIYHLNYGVASIPLS